MKKIFNIQTLFLMGMVLLVVPFLSSCEDDEQTSVSINSVWTNQLDVESTQIDASYNDLWVRLEGNGFSGLQAIYCNGVRCDFQTTFVTDNYITFLIPTTVPQNADVENEAERGTIRLVTNHGEAVYRDFLFKDKNKMPAISSVSHTLPVPGQTIVVKGNNLGGTTEVYFPGENGEIVSTQIEIVSAQEVAVVVPQGTGSVSGALRVVCNGDNFYSPSYMFFRKGIFLNTFTEDVMIAGGSSRMKIYASKTDLMAATGGTAVNTPESGISFDAAPADVPVAANNNAQYAHFKFWLGKGIRKVIDSGAMGASTTLNNIAIQFDLYMLTPWTSGVIGLKLNKNNAGINSANVYNIASWSVGKPVVFNGRWQTITVKFSDYPTLSTAQNLTAFIEFVESGSKEQLLGFYNFDVNADGHTATLLTGFQMFIANMRIVPTTVPEAN